MEDNKNAQNSGIITKIKGKLGITNKNIPFTAEYACLCVGKIGGFYFVYLTFVGEEQQIAVV